MDDEREIGKLSVGELTPKLRFDDVLSEVGHFGRYQKLMIAFVLLPAFIPSGFLDWSLVFLTANPPDYWCTAAFSNRTSANNFKFNSSLPRKECYQLHINESISDHDEYPISTGNSSQTSCQNGWSYDRSLYTETIVTEWDLVCDQKSLRPLAMTISSVGGLFGPLIWGFLADRIGRKRGFFTCIAFQSIFSIFTGFSPNLIWFCLCRFCVGMTTSASYTIPYDLLLEITGRKTRGVLSILCSTSYTFGCLLFLLIAYFVRSWRDLSFASAVPSAALYVIIWGFFPESPRWLLSQGRYDDLEKFLRRIARINRRTISIEFQANFPEILRSMDTEDHAKRHNFLDLFLTPNMCRKTLILVFLNVCNKGVSQGLNYFAPELHDNAYMSAFLTIAVAFPLYILAKPAFAYLGRRISLTAALFIASLACMATVIPTPFASIVLVLSLIVKFCITFTYLTGKLVESEVFPTVVRSEGHSVVSVLSAVITAPVPYIVDLSHTLKVFPLLVFGTFCLVAAFLVLLLPETANEELPQTLEEGENIGMLEMKFDEKVSCSKDPRI